MMQHVRKKMGQLKSVETLKTLIITEENDALKTNIWNNESQRWLILIQLKLSTTDISNEIRVILNIFAIYANLN